MLGWRTWILLCLLLSGCKEPPSGPPFDPNIEGLNLVKWVEGDDAIKAINKLHGMPVDIVKGFIADYQSTGGKVTIWVSEALSRELAKKQMATMIHKMKSSTRSPFGHYRTLHKKDFSVISFDGMGQVHYVFKDNKWVYWISADKMQIEKILQHVGKTRTDND